MVKRRASKQRFALSRKFDNKGYSIYALRRYSTKRDADADARSLRTQGYASRVVKRAGYYLIYIRKKSWYE